MIFLVRLNMVLTQHYFPPKLPLNMCLAGFEPYVAKIPSLNRHHSPKCEMWWSSRDILLQFNEYDTVEGLVALDSLYHVFI